MHRKHVVVHVLGNSPDATVFFPRCAARYRVGNNLPIIAILGGIMPPQTEGPTMTTTSLLIHAGLVTGIALALLTGLALA
jgi:hypothetical protein